MIDPAVSILAMAENATFDQALVHMAQGGLAPRAVPKGDRAGLQALIRDAAMLDPVLHGCQAAPMLVRMRDKHRNPGWGYEGASAPVAVVKTNPKGYAVFTGGAHQNPHHRVRVEDQFDDAMHVAWLLACDEPFRPGT